jgi:hypothetical protein
MSASAGTRKFEYGAESMLDLNREEKPEDAAGESKVTLTVQKNRHGRANQRIPLLFRGATQTFREPDGKESLP